MNSLLGVIIALLVVLILAVCSEDFRDLTVSVVSLGLSVGFWLFIAAMVIWLGSVAFVKVFG